ncbi:hypothetical protein DESHY_20142 [Desulforamulus hydrothermalis Lam5 = DSM 18033]|uniref:Uncharacterized protein n=1 Tax=Desulforamulus hydrothermalis Lam5 = DSM 18033 TaxID=1121428 RepID=K8E9L5_9FIRM|nr:hypothetical protein DESHY_20142 [Desulforamulus hydrothermalis Lam5 = DSM 18033]
MGRPQMRIGLYPATIYLGMTKFQKVHPAVVFLIPNNVTLFTRE